MRAPLHPSITARVDRYFDFMDAALPGRLKGFYLVGSIALDDFQVGSSDIDFIALIDDAAPPDPIEAVHRRLSEEGGPVLDGFYVTHHQARQAPNPARVLPFERAGRFHRTEACFEANPVTWTIWRDHAVTLRGPMPRTLGLHIDRDELIRFERENLASYWTDWVAQQRRKPDDPIAASWGVLGVLRLAQVLATGTISSKTAAARWALGTCSPCWHATIRDALSVRLETKPRIISPDALDFIDFVIAGYQG